jgi:hypothetical protein
MIKTHDEYTRRLSGSSVVSGNLKSIGDNTDFSRFGLGSAGYRY